MSALLSDDLPVLRDMTEADLASVMKVEQAVYDFPWSEGIFRDCMRVGYFCWVYESSEGVVGYGIMSVGAGECHLLNLCIHPDYQRRGLGRHMIEKLIDTARHHRARMAFLEVRQSNRGAYCLYQKLGFDEVGVRKDYYPARSGREDAFILARII